MSKCREEFEKHFGNDAFPPSLEDWHCWKAAWNIRGKVDAEICESFMTMQDDAHISDIIAEAIEQEDEK